MSCNVGEYLACPNIQENLIGHFGELSGNYREPSPFTEFLVSSQNTQNVLQREVAPPGNAKIRTVVLRYESRFTENQVEANADIDCTGGQKPGETSAQYDIDPDVGSKIKWTIELADLRTRCEDDPIFFARQMQKAIDVMIRDINTKNWTKAATLFGVFPTTGNSTKIDIATKNSSGVYVPEAIEKVRYEFMQMDYYGTPALFGGSETFYNYFQAMQAACCNSTFGIDLGLMFSQKRLVPFFDRKAESALGSGEFLAMAPGALQWIYYNRYDGPRGIVMIDTETEKAGIIVDPITGIKFDYYAKYDCQTWNFTLSVAHDLVGLPTDLFCADDRMTGVTWVNNFDIVNPMVA